VVVTLRSITPVSFTSRCYAIAGRIEVLAVTSGDDLDLDGYTLETSGVARRDIPVNGPVARIDMTGGTSEVRLAKVAKNCVVTDGDTRTVTISTGGPVQDTARISFEVQCHRLWELALVRGDRLVFATRMVGQSSKARTDPAPSGRPKASAWHGAAELSAWRTSRLA
jgi:hypothetical protein